MHQVSGSSPTLAVLTNTMKNYKNNFKNNTLVKPLYKKVSKKRNNLLTTNNCKLDGNEPIVTRTVPNLSEVIVINQKVDYNLPGACDYKREIKLYKEPEISKLKSKAMLDNVESEIGGGLFENGNGNTDKLIQAQRSVVIQNVSDVWLRMYPSPRLPKESVCSVIFRCMLCQLGLAILLTLWTLIWVFIIHFFENPYELKIAQDTEKIQNQLVIDLATELRQISPLSPRWRGAIEKRINEERRLTVLAVAEGAQLNPGRIWDLSGTFLFCVFVMTTLGFGAPVPHTAWGRNMALIYAVIAVPTHIYLMVNIGKCLIVNLELCCYKKKAELNTEHEGRHIESQKSNRNSELVEVTRKRSLRKKILRWLSLTCACRCVPLVAVLYYAFGSIVFGALRGKPPMQVLMFPLEFTTTGGLEQVEGYIRVLYAIYVEGAMVVISCALATLRRYSANGVNTVAERYRLFHVQRS